MLTSYARCVLKITENRLTARWYSSGPPPGVGDLWLCSSPLRHSLPDYVVDVDTVDIFKSRLDKFWKDQDVMFDCDADLTGTGNRSEFEIESD